MSKGSPSPGSEQLGENFTPTLHLVEVMNAWSSGDMLPYAWRYLQLSFTNRTEVKFARQCI
jgi:hypothetical protein